MTKKATEEYGAQVVGCYSPPFAPLEEYNMQDIAKKINESGANIVWTSLRAPKQDFLNAKLLPLLNDGIVLIGVGAAFRSVIGGLRQPDGILQKGVWRACFLNVLILHGYNKSIGILNILII